MIPKWFLQLFGGLMSLFVLTFLPWASWLTINNIRISIQLETHAEYQTKLGAEIQLLRERQQKQTDETRLVDVLKLRIERLESQLESVSKSH